MSKNSEGSGNQNQNKTGKETPKAHNVPDEQNPEKRETTLGQDDGDRDSESTAGKQEQEGTTPGGQPLSKNNSRLKDPTELQNSPEEQERKSNAS